MASLKTALHHQRELVKMPYPPLVRQEQYYVVRGKGKRYQPLFFGDSHDVARLVVNVMPGAYLVG